MKIIWWLGLSSLTALLYWFGGRSWGNKAIRRFGCPLVIYGYLWVLRPFSLLQGATVGIFAYILTALALSTYHDYLAPDGSSENWLCWLMTGFCYGLSALPFVLIGISWYSVIIRTVFLAISIMWLREKTRKVFVEEFFSGLIYCGSIPLLLL